MKPTIVYGDRIFVNKMAYGFRVPFTMLPVARWSEPARGDVVVFESSAADKRLVKRVIGVPGDTVQLIANRLYINGRQAEYHDAGPDSQLTGRNMTGPSPVVLYEYFGSMQHEVALSHGQSFFGPVQVPENQLFVLGDNRDFSADSRYIGFVPMDEILGKATGVIVSLDPENYYLPRKARYFRAFDRNT